MSVTYAVSAPPKLLQLDEGLEKENQAVVICIFSGSLAKDCIVFGNKTVEGGNSQILKIGVACENLTA